MSPCLQPISSGYPSENPTVKHRQADTDKKLVNSMQQIKDLAADRDLKATQLADLEIVAQVVVNMVEDSEAGDKTLLERLRDFN